MSYTVYLPTIQNTPKPVLARPSALDEINSYRRYHGMDTLTAHDGLMTSARLYAEYMRDNTYFRHADDWLDRILPHYPDWLALAELLAAGFPDAASAMQALYFSPSHGAAMLSELYTEAGIGYAPGGDRYGHWWVVHLGNRQRGE